MSTENVISTEIPQQIMDEACSHAAIIRDLLRPYLQSLSESERKDLFKLGDKSVGYLEKIMGYVGNATQFVPPFMDVSEFKKDTAVVVSLQPLYQLLSPLLSDVEDTRMLAGSEAMTAAKMYYGSVRLAADQNIQAAKTIYQDLQERFPGRAGNGNTANKGR